MTPARAGSGEFNLNPAVEAEPACPFDNLSAPSLSRGWRSPLRGAEASTAEFRSNEYRADASKHPDFLNHGSFDHFWTLCRHRNARLLRSGATLVMVHSRVFGSVCDGVHLWLSAGRLAVRLGRSSVVARGTNAMVADPVSVITPSSSIRR